MNILESTRRYEKWLAAHTSVVKPDLVFKHAQMRRAVFPFLRATFYRWVQLWNEHCADLVKAPRVLGVGDLHVENFGTWRDAEGRLIWGINDFDEACDLPYTNDLVRLTVSAHLAIRGEHLEIGRRDAADLILEGYSETLSRGGRPFVLDEEHQFLRTIAHAELRDPVHFWHGIRNMPKFRGAISKSQREALELMLPHPITPYRVVMRRAGLGSLGRVRLVAVSDWHGGLVAREIKAFLPSAWNFQDSHYSEIIARAVRVPDPFVSLCGDWVVRRLAPDCSRIELSTLPRKRDEARLLRAMGSEAANIHLSTPRAVEAIQRDLEHRPASWLRNAAKAMSKAVLQDWKLFSRR